MKEYIQLQDEIKDFIHERWQDRFLWYRRKQHGCPPTPPWEPKHPRPKIANQLATSMINTITGRQHHQQGFIVNPSKRQKIEEAITFSEEDA